MGVENVRNHLKRWNKDKDVLILHKPSATVEMAAVALGVSESEIAKTISLYDKHGGAVLIVISGNRKLDNKKFKDEFGFKARMLVSEEVEEMTGHPVGGVCPFGVHPRVRVFLDESLKKFDYVYPACGDENSAIKLSISELEVFSECIKWINVTRE